MTEQGWFRELRMLEERGVSLAPGLTEAELVQAERIHRFRFPPDLRSFLSSALPVGDSFPDWREPGSPALVDRFAWPFDGMAFDIEQSSFWWEPWGRRPETTRDAISLARKAFEGASTMIPVYSHRYLPSEPELAGNPVFSIHQTDIIYYGLDLRDYLACEFGTLAHADAVRGEPRRIRFWTELVESDM